MHSECVGKHCISAHCVYMLYVYVCKHIYHFILYTVYVAVISVDDYKYRLYLINYYC